MPAGLAQEHIEHHAMQLAAVGRLLHPLGEDVEAPPLQFQDARGRGQDVAVAPPLKRALGAIAQQVECVGAIAVRLYRFRP